jgi:hypothetical protein
LVRTRPDLEYHKHGHQLTSHCLWNAESAPVSRCHPPGSPEFLFRPQEPRPGPRSDHYTGQPTHPLPHVPRYCHLNTPHTTHTTHTIYHVLVAYCTVLVQGS